MKKLSVLFAGMLLAGSLFAQVGLEYSLGISSNYVWRGYDFGVSPMAAPDVTVSLGETGLWLDVWGAFGSNYKEVDFTVGYDMELNDELSLEPGLVYYWNNLDFDASAIEPYVRATYSALPLPVNALAAFDVTNSSLYLEPGTEYETEVSGYPLYLVAVAGLEFNSNVKALTHIRVDAGTELTLGPVLLAPTLSAYLITSDKVNPNSFEGVLSLSLSLAE